MKSVKHLYERWRQHLSDIDSALYYPNLMFSRPPTGCDMRSQYEMELHWNYRRKILQRLNDPMFPKVTP